MDAWVGGWVGGWVDSAFIHLLSSSFCIDHYLFLAFLGKAEHGNDQTTASAVNLMAVTSAAADGIQPEGVAVAIATHGFSNDGLCDPLQPNLVSVAYVDFSSCPLRTHSVRIPYTPWNLGDRDLTNLVTLEVAVNEMCVASWFLCGG